MIPEFDEPATCRRAFIARRWRRSSDGSEIRGSQFQSICWLLELIAEARIKRFVINGSFTTDELEPNDVDCVLLIDEETLAHDEPLRKIMEGLPFLDIQIVLQERYDYLVEHFFATDRRRTPKGMIEVLP